MNGKCAVCALDTSTRCSGCKEIYFCSAAHQKLLWHTHKFLCKIEDRDVFRVPPLTTGEATFVRENLRNVNVVGGVIDQIPDLAGKTILEFLEHHDLYAGTWEDLLEGTTAGSQDPIEEPYLSALCIVIRSQMMTPSRPFLRWPAHPLTYRCHSMFALFALDFLSIVPNPVHRFEEPDNPASTFRAMNDMFRKFQDYTTVLRLNGEMEEVVPNAMLLPLIRRAQTADMRQADPRLSDYAKQKLTNSLRTWGPRV